VFQIASANSFLGFSELEQIYTKYRIETVGLEYIPNGCFRNLLAQAIPDTDPVCLLLGDLWGAMVHGSVSSTVSLSDVVTSQTASPIEFDRRRKWNWTMNTQDAVETAFVDIFNAPSSELGAMYFAGFSGPYLSTVSSGAPSETGVSVDLGTLAITARIRFANLRLG
jgi:hypothetical protein